MAQLRAKQIKLSAVGDLLVGGANGNGVALPAGADKTVLKVVAGGLQYAQQIAEDVVFSGAGFTATDVKGAVIEATTKAATALTDAVAAEVTARDAAIKVADDRAVAAEAELQAAIDALTGLNALHFSGELAGTDTLPASPKQGDVYRVTTAATDFLDTGLEVNVGDFIAYTGVVWVKFDNTDPTFTGDSNITVTGSAHAGFSLSLTGIVSVAKGGTGLSAAGTQHSVLTSNADGSLSYSMVSGLRDEAGVLVVDATSGKLVATTATTAGDAALTYTTKGFVDAAVAAAAAAAARTIADEDFAQVATAANAVVTLAHTPVGDVSVFFNGVKLAKTGYTVSGSTVTLVDSAIGYGVDAGDTISATYAYNA